MNILLTSIGRRNYMVDYFKQELKPIGGKVHAMNSEINSVGLWAADHQILSPLIYSDEYEGFLLNYCVNHQIKAVISFFDIELPILSKFKQKFKRYEIQLIVADQWVTDMANDKWLTFNFLKEHGISTASTFIELDKAKDAINSGKLNYPVFIKPRWGMGSLSIHMAKNENELNFYYNKTQESIFNSYLKYESQKAEQTCVIIQGALPGTEFGLDIINDLDGNHIVTVVKQKLSMRSGETDGAITIKSEKLEELGAKLASITKHPANMDVDVFWDGNEARILEINPRFGGGYPFSHVAGINLPKAIIKWLNNEYVECADYFIPKIGIKALKGISIIQEHEGK